MSAFSSRRKINIWVNVAQIFLTLKRKYPNTDNKGNSVGQNVKKTEIVIGQRDN